MSPERGIDRPLCLPERSADSLTAEATGDNQAGVVDERDGRHGGHRVRPYFLAVTPDLPPHYVDRPRLLSPLRALGRLDRGILAVWGTAGSGKSTLLASWARHLVASGSSVDWLSHESVSQLLAELADRAGIRIPG